MPITVREATLADLEALLDIRLASFEGGEQWMYRYPYYHQYPEDHAVAARRRMEAYLKDESGASGHVMLAEAPCNEDPGVRVPVALAVWRMPSCFIRMGESAKMQAPVEIVSQFPHRDTHAAHVRAFKMACKEAQKSFLPPSCDQLYLHNIGTRPDYRRRGAATALIQWGLSLAVKENLPVTLLANSVAISFYAKLNFVPLASVKVSSGGDADELVITPMIHEGQPSS